MTRILAEYVLAAALHLATLSLALLAPLPFTAEAEQGFEEDRSN